jgi:hypothetical protein
MYVEHPAFKKPEDTNVVIWRYLTFTKFASLIISKSLFFSNIKELRRFDPFEGTLPGGNRKLRVMSSDDNDQSRQDFFRQYDDLSETVVRDMVVANCWHMNVSESAAMWKLYIPNGEGVAIRSTFDRLSRCFVVGSGMLMRPDGKPFEIFIGEMDYIDHEEGYIPENNALYRVTHKDPGFTHEHELRAAALVFAQDNANLPYYGISFPVDLQILIESLVLPPGCPEWIKELIFLLITQYDVIVPIKESKLQIRFS